jgi:hypothetical protein
MGHGSFSPQRHSLASTLKEQSFAQPKLLHELGMLACTPPNINMCQAEAHDSKFPFSIPL